jgi:tetratricopeptide (TPR) repeat protein
MLAPTNLCFDYSYRALEPVRRWGDLRLWAGVAVLLLACVAAVISVRRQGRVALALAFTAVTYSIVSNVLIVIGTIFGERLLYLPNVGYCMLIGLAAGFAFRRQLDPDDSNSLITRRLAAVGLIALGMWYGYLTVDRNTDWRSSYALHQSGYRVNPRSCKVLSGMAANALAGGDYAQALRYCQASMNEDVAPDYWPAWRTAGVTLRKMSARETDPRRKQFFAEQAMHYLARSLQLGGGGDPDAVLGTAELSIETAGDYAQGIRLAEQLVQYRPTQAQAFDKLARWLLEAEPPELRDPARALECARQAHRLKPRIANYIATLVDALIATGRTQEARALVEDTLPTLPAGSPGIAEFQRRLEQLGP